MRVMIPFVLFACSVGLFSSSVPFESALGSIILGSFVFQTFRGLKLPPGFVLRSCYSLPACFAIHVLISSISSHRKVTCNRVIQLRSRWDLFLWWWSLFQLKMAPFAIKWSLLLKLAPPRGYCHHHSGVAHVNKYCLVVPPSFKFVLYG